MRSIHKLFFVTDVAGGPIQKALFTKRVSICTTRDVRIKGRPNQSTIVLSYVTASLSKNCFRDLRGSQCSRLYSPMLPRQTAETSQSRVQDTLKSEVNKPRTASHKVQEANSYQSTLVRSSPGTWASCLINSIGKASGSSILATETTEAPTTCLAGGPAMVRNPPLRRCKC